ncbi:MAG: IclR family transcriptional regulator, partial [Achromobacter mucicolens]
GERRDQVRLPIFSCGARDPYTSSWSVPVIGQEDRFVGALTIAGPSARLKTVDAKAFEAMILERADDLSRRLGASSDMRAVLYRPDAS